ncbi:MAG: restriction endonuclease [Gaiellaceae bacterium]
MTTQVSYALQEAIVQACGTVFWYKRPLKALLVRAGVPPPLVKKYEDASKFIMVREILAELDARGETGVRVEQQLARELAAMRTVSDPDNQEAGLRALADLREVAKQEGLIEDADAAAKVRAKQHRATVEERHRAAEARARGLAELHDIYMTLATREDEAQQRGYDLEDLLGRLFKLHDIPYQPPYRKGTVEQTDGFFTFNSFQYLIEARWRKKPPDLGELTAFSGKVRRKIDSTRGLFISVAGFREEVLQEAASLLNLILMDGQDLALILEGRVSLIEALQIKLDKAAQQGILFHSLAEHV